MSALRTATLLAVLVGALGCGHPTAGNAEMFAEQCLDACDQIGMHRTGVWFGGNGTHTCICEVAEIRELEEDSR